MMKKNEKKFDLLLFLSRKCRQITIRKQIWKYNSIIHCVDNYPNIWVIKNKQNSSNWKFLKQKQRPNFFS